MTCVDCKRLEEFDEDMWLLYITAAYKDDAECDDEYEEAYNDAYDIQQEASLSLIMHRATCDIWQTEYKRKWNIK